MAEMQDGLDLYRKLRARTNNIWYKTKPDDGLETLKRIVKHGELMFGK